MTPGFEDSNSSSQLPESSYFKFSHHPENVCLLKDVEVFAILTPDCSKDAKRPQFDILILLM